MCCVSTLTLSLCHNSCLTQSGISCIATRTHRKVAVSKAFSQAFEPITHSRYIAGEVLLLVQLVEKSAPSVFVPIVPASIAPATVPAFIDIIALGVRNLRPVDFMPVYMPLTEFDLGDQSKSTNIQRTKYSKRPSGANANFQQRLTFPVDLPVNPLFAPSLNATVRDQRLGGLLTPVVGAQR